MQWIGKNFSEEEFDVVREEKVPLDRVIMVYALVFFEFGHMTDPEEQNAIRHALWQCLPIEIFGEDFATKIVDS